MSNPSQLYAMPRVAVTGFPAPSPCPAPPPSPSPVKGEGTHQSLFTIFVPNSLGLPPRWGEGDVPSSYLPQPGAGREAC